MQSAVRCLTIRHAEILLASLAVICHKRFIHLGTAALVPLAASLRFRFLSAALYFFGVTPASRNVQADVFVSKLIGQRLALIPGPSEFSSGISKVII